MITVSPREGVSQHELSSLAAPFILVRGGVFSQKNCGCTQTMLDPAFLMPFSLANFSHLVIGFTCGGSGFVRGNGVVPER